jgi:hypothetical protein
MGLPGGVLLAGLDERRPKTGKTPLINPTFTSLSYLDFTVGVVIPVSLEICLKDFLPSSEIELRIDTSVSSRLRGIQVQFFYLITIYYSLHL